MNPINSSDFRREIEYNLEIMEKTLQKNVAIDAGFFEIFQRDIEHLEAMSASNSKNRVEAKKITSTLNIRLQTNAARLQQITGKAFGFVEHVVPFLAANSVSPKEFIKNYSPSEHSLAIRGLTALDSAGYNVRKIKGDGHCLFRGIAAKDLIESARAQRKSHVLVLAQKIVTAPGLYSDKLVKCARRAIEILEPITDEKSLIVLLQDQKSSDRLVKFLRNVAVDHQRRHIDKFASFHEGEKGSFADHLNSMARMSLRQMGDQPEIVALQEALQMQLPVVNLRNLGGNQEIVQEGEAHQGSLQLLYDGQIHYDLAEKMS